MGKRVGSIQADGDATYAGVHDHAGHFLCDQRTVGRQSNPKSLVCAITRQLEDV